MLLFGIVLVFVWSAVFCFFIYLSDGFFGKLDFTTTRSGANNVIKILKDRNLENGKFYDLGSCRGGLAIKIARNFPNFQVYGIDDSRLRVFLAKARGAFLKNLKFETGDLFTQDVSSANIVYLYLPQELMPELQIKLQKELKPGSLVISNSVSFPNWQPNESLIFKKTKLFIYVKV